MNKSQKILKAANNEIEVGEQLFLILAKIVLLARFPADFYVRIFQSGPDFRDETRIKLGNNMRIKRVPPSLSCQPDSAISMMAHWVSSDPVPISVPSKSLY
jgi:hypothetical protein